MREAVGTLAPLDAPALPGALPARAMDGASPIVVAWRRLARNPLALVGSLVALAYILLGLIGPIFAPYDYAKQNLLQANLPPLSAGHLLGTDQVGRDLFSRLVTGIRISLIVGFGVTAISMVVGTTAGAIAGYRRGWTDSLISGVVEFTWGFPLILLAVIFAAPAVGIHGTPQAFTIGHAASHGCIRMRIPDVERLFNYVDVGESVEFRT